MGRITILFHPYCLLQDFSFSPSKPFQRTHTAHHGKLSYTARSAGLSQGNQTVRFGEVVLEKTGAVVKDDIRHDKNRTSIRCWLWR
ncbi:MAG: hypothetical protein ABF893_09610 [Gluconacetobacter liquefaciens]